MEQTGSVYDFALPAPQLAPLLLGGRLSFGGVCVRLTEVEAYAGLDDPAAHAWGGERPRTKDLFGPPGTLYCYLSYGLHICGNLVCGTGGAGSAILFRSARIEAGLELAKARRGAVSELSLARGPGNLGRALGLTLADSGRHFNEAELSLLPGPNPAEIRSGPRVGVSRAWQRPWRFWVAGESSVSAYRRSPRTVPGQGAW